MTPDVQHASLDSFLSKYNVTYINIENSESLDKIYNLFVNDDTSKEPVNGVEYNYFGLYYEHVKHDFVKAKTYYLLGVEHHNSNSMNNLALYYNKFEIDVDKMIKLYLMAIELKNPFAMGHLANYYYIIDNYELMEKYYLMSIELNHTNSMANFGYYYFKQKDFIQMKKYYRMAFQNKSTIGIQYFAEYYGWKNKWSKALDLYMLKPDEFKQEILSIFTNQQDILQTFLRTHVDTVKENTELKLYVEHLKYKPGNVGAKKAKSHFESLIA